MFFMASIEEYRQLFRAMRRDGPTGEVILELRRLVAGLDYLDEVALITDAETVSFREFIRHVIKLNQEKAERDSQTDVKEILES